MNPKSDAVYLRHILDAIARIEAYTDGVSYQQFRQRRLIQDGVIRQLEIIGEAGSNVSKELRSRYPDVEWGSMVGMRNRLIHVYFQVDLSIVWDTTQSDLPVLRQQVEAILAEIEDQQRDSKDGTH